MKTVRIEGTPSRKTLTPLKFSNRQQKQNKYGCIHSRDQFPVNFPQFHSERLDFTWTGKFKNPTNFCCKRIVENALLSALYRIIFSLMNSLFRYWSQIVSNIPTQYIFSFSCDETYMIEENYGYEGKLFTTILWCQDSFLCIILYMCWKVLTY